MSVILAVAYILGILSALHALMGTRTSQGSIAWIVSLLSFPLLAVPAYWVFGRSKFNGYVFLRRSKKVQIAAKIEEIRRELAPYIVPGDKGQPSMAGVGLAGLPYLEGNRVDLLVDGQMTFESLFQGIDRAQVVLLVQFYIVRDDALGRALKDRCIARARAGVAVYFLYDEIGSRDLADYVRELRAAGVRVSAFNSTRGSGNRFQLNFRNHRKIVVVDGEVGWVGGHNVGDEYVGADWRDTHVKIVGPAAKALQLSFLEDWHWATGEVIDAPWQPKLAPDGAAKVLIVPSGPADHVETCSLLYQQAIHAAKERCWIASPYFVPDEGTLASLHLASLRGVDVRVVIPEMPDNILVYYSAYAFLGPLLDNGVKVYRYQRGFLHEKVFLVDRVVAGVGTANLDNRSFRLNFEVTALINDGEFIRRTEAMLLDDFRRSRQMTAPDIAQKPRWFKVLSRAAYLAAPVQ